MSALDMLMGLLPYLGVALAIIIILAVSRLGYVVVPPNQIHVVVHRGRGRTVYSARKEFKSSYWRIPILQQRIVLPAENVQLQINGISLRDSNMAKFKGDVVAWVNIDNPELASERLGFVKDENTIFQDISNLIQAVTRNTSMYWSILDILKNRKEFSAAVEKSVNEEFGAWGMKLVELEVIHFLDDQNYTVIKDLEERQASIINAETRKLVAGQRKEAEIVESTAKKDTAVQVATNDELAKLREITRDEMVGKRNADKDKLIAEQQRMANEASIASQKVKTVGEAEIAKEAAIKKAEGESQAKILTEATVPAQTAKLVGEGEAEATRAKMFAEADGTDKRAEALKKFNDAGITLEYLKAVKDVEMNKWNNWGQALGVAKINVYAGGEGGNLFGMPMNPSSAFSLGAFSSIAKAEGGIDIEKIAESIGGKALPIVDLTKTAMPNTKPEKKKGG